MIKLSASINPCDENKIVEYSEHLQNMGCDYIHCDVMRSNFVGHDALSASKIREIWDNTLMPLDVHLMVAEPISIIKEYIKIKPNIITIHYEAFEDKTQLLKCFDMIRKSHILVGLSINPKTFVKDIKTLLPYVDVVLIMGVEPGKSGQKMISNTCPKIKELRGIVYEYDYPIKIEVDGGVTAENLKDVVNAGVDIVVMGSALYNSSDKTKIIKTVHKF